MSPELFRKLQVLTFIIVFVSASNMKARAEEDFDTEVEQAAEQLFLEQSRRQRFRYLLDEIDSDKEKPDCEEDNEPKPRKSHDRRPSDYL